jgi:hypothetical protein
MQGSGRDLIWEIPAFLHFPQQNIVHNEKPLRISSLWEETWTQNPPNREQKCYQYYSDIRSCDIYFELWKIIVRYKNGLYWIDIWDGQ